MRLLRFALLLCPLLVGFALHAQAVHWENGDSAFGSSVQLVFEDCEPDGDPQLPAIPNTTLTLAGSSTTMNVVNLNVTRSVILAYSVQATRGGPLRIPAFTVKTNKGPLQVAAFNGAAPSITADSVGTSTLNPERTSVWAGEVFALHYKINVARRNNPQFPSLDFDWNPSPLVAEEWGKPAMKDLIVNGQRHVVLDYPTRAYAKTAGNVTLQSAHQVVNVQTGAVGFGLFSQARMEPVSINSDQPAIEVRPLPAPPAGFTGAVGKFKLTSKVVPKQAGVGEPVTWTLELSGTGNWPDIAGLPARDVSKDFQVVQPKAKRTPADGKLFDTTLAEDVVLVPTKAGSYTLGPVSFTFFNPDSGAYETVHTESATVNITAPATLSPFGSGPTTASSGSTATSAGSAETHVAPQPPAAPAGIPRDPLAGTASAARPLSTGALVAWVLAPLGGLLLFWFFLAWRHALATDPLRPQREAYARLSALLTAMEQDAASGAQPNAARLLAWQHEAALLWGVSHAAPSPTLLEQAAATTPLRVDGGDTPATAAQWAALWREADRALYGAGGALPKDWVVRAEAAVGAVRVPAFRAIRLFLPQNLLAFAAAVALVLVVSAPALRAAGSAPEASYRAGDFAAAEKAWRETVNEHPTDWIARHNLSLALAQQDHAGEAAAQATAAFVQHPAEPAVRWHFGMMTEKAGFVPEALSLFLKDGPAADLAAHASPAVWQRYLIVAAFVLAGALGWMLFNAYHRRTRAQLAAAAGVGAVAVLLGLLSVLGMRAYGDAADRRAVVTWQPGTLRSIPTEADTTQKTTALPAGSIAVVDRTFLGRWDRLVFANGQTGWVRHEDVVPLWER